MKNRIIIICAGVLIICGVLFASNYHSASKTNGHSSSISYKDGTYNGSVNNAYYGNVQVKVNIQKGKIVNVSYLQYPTSDTTSIYIAKGILPYLNKEVIKAQSAHINIISSATYTSDAYISSLSSALQKAQ